MKKKIVFALFFVLCFSSIWAVWEGNGGIGANSEFPVQGLFVRSDMFPKHTLLEITNLEKNKTARAVVVGPSGIPGLLISISPALGNELAIPSGKVVRVRVLTPSPVQEIGDDGLGFTMSDVESKDSDDNPAMLIANNTKPETVVIAEKTPVVKEEPVVEAPPVKEEIKEEPVKKAPPVKEEVKEVEEPKPEPVKKEEAAEDTLIFYDDIEKEDSPTPKTKPVYEKEEPVVIKEIKEEVIPEPVVIAKEEPQKLETEIYMEPTDMRPPKTVGGITQPKKAKKRERAVKEVNSPKQRKVKKAKTKNAAVKFVDSPKKKKEEKDIENTPDVEVIAQIKERETIKKKAPIAPVSDAPPMGEEPIEKTDKQAEVEEIGERADKPKAEVKEDNEEKDMSIEAVSVEEIEVEKADDVLIENEDEKDKEMDIEAVSVEEIEVEKADDVLIEDEEPEVVEEAEDVYVAKAPVIKEKPKDVPKTKLQKGKRYVQIVVYHKKAQAEAVIEEYGDQYPMILEEKQGRKKRQYIVFIGPLQEEETGAIIEYFSKLGFKGSFVKKGK